MDKVVVLLSSYNGEKYIQEQILSLKKQKNVNISLIIRDDGSEDATVQVIRKLGYDCIIGENIGYIQSFMWLLLNAPEADYYAFCDQDDVWDDDKLEVAIKSLNSLPGNGAKLYNGNARLVDAELNYIKNENKTPTVSLGSSLVKNFATGCTVVFNKELLRYIRRCPQAYVSSHDSWLSRVCLAVGGQVFFDETPHINYRQHGSNTVGSNYSVISKLMCRLRKLKNNTSHSRSRTAKELLKYYSDELNDDNRKLLESIIDYEYSIEKKIQMIFNRKLSTGNLSDDIQFRIAVLLKWV